MMPQLLNVTNWFRAGSAYTSNGAVEFLKECYERIPQRIFQIFVRADSGFFDGELLDFLESRHSEYLIKVKMKNLKRFDPGLSMFLQR